MARKSVERTGAPLGVPRQGRGSVERLAALVAGGVLATIGLMRRDLTGALLSGFGSGLVYFGARGSVRRSLASKGARLGGSRTVFLMKSVTVLESPEVMFDRWRDVRKLANVFSHVREVRDDGAGTARWTLFGAGDYLAELKTRVTVEEDERRISWRTTEASELRHWGFVTVSRAPGDRGTELHVILEYEARGLRATSALSRLMDRDPPRLLADDLRRHKQMIECGEVATTRGQPRGKGTLSERLGRPLTRRVTRRSAPREVEVR